MNNMDYLNQIAGSVQVQKGVGGESKLLTPLMIKIIVVGVATLVILVIAGGMLGGLASKAMDLSKQLDVRMTNLIELEETYGKEVKSPKLRSIGDTFRGVMVDTTRDLGEYLKEKDGFEAKKVSGKLADDEEETNNELAAVLEDARLNGLLDEAFVREMNYQIVLMLSMESEVVARTNDEDLQKIMNTSTESLKNIQSGLENL